MISIGYGVAVIYLSALAASALGAFFLGKQVYRSRSATVFFFMWGILGAVTLIVVVTGLIYGLGFWPRFPYLLHFHEAEVHLHYTVPVHDEPLTICHHITYFALQLPPQTYLVPLLAAGIPLASFLVNQSFMGRVHAKLVALQNRKLSKDLKGKMARYWPSEKWELTVIEGTEPEAFSYALFRPRLRPLRFAQDVVVITGGLYQLLREEEIIASLAHEFAHLEANDHRYLTFFKTLCSVVFFDPTVLFMSYKLCKEAEFKADFKAVNVTKDPMALARALFKLYFFGNREGMPSSGASALAKIHVVERINRLLAMARDMGLPSGGHGQDGGDGPALASER